MGRRIEVAGGVHHVTARSPSGRLLFRDEADRRLYLDLLGTEVRARGWLLLTYCQMTNHLHELVLTPEPDLGDGMKAIHERFARETNRRHGEWGHLFGRRFHNAIVETEQHLYGCLRYIARNPVEAGMCAMAADWRWSAHRTLAGLGDDEPFVAADRALAYLQPDRAAAQQAYRAMVARTDGELLSELRATGAEWPATAVDDFRIPIAEVARFMGRSVSRTYAIVAASRENATGSG